MKNIHVLPQEEPKQTDEKGRPMTYWGGLEEPKKETLEEVAENFWLNDDSMTDNDRISYVNGFLACAKWQQEQIGKSEFLQRLRATLSDTFKKK
jgi:hypothetical protein